MRSEWAWTDFLSYDINPQPKVLHKINCLCLLNYNWNNEKGRQIFTGEGVYSIATGMDALGQRMCNNIFCSCFTASAFSCASDPFRNLPWKWDKYLHISAAEPPKIPLIVRINYIRHPTSTTHAETKPNTKKFVCVLCFVSPWLVSLLGVQ